MKVHLRLVTLAFLAGVTLGMSARAEDFRIDTDVFLENGTEPVSETLTVFSGDVVYDFILTGPEEITVFDVQRGRIVLLDSVRSVKTTLTTDQLLELSAAIKSVAQANERQALTEPEFTVRFDESSGMLELSSSELVYRAKGIKPKVDSAVERFQAFADWYARLNAVRPGNLPPFGRIQLNQALAERHLVPEEIERTITRGWPLGDRKARVKSRLSFIWTLSTTDRKRIERAGRQQATFQNVSPAEYWQTPQDASKSS